METQTPTKRGRKKKPTNVVDATDAFHEAQPELTGTETPQPPPAPPLVFTAGQIDEAGVVVQESEKVRVVELNTKSQAALIALSPGYTQNEILQAALIACGVVGKFQYRTDPDSLTLTVTQHKPGHEPPVVAPPPAPVETDEVIKERGQIYGDPELSHQNIGLNWTGMIQQHYQLRLDHPLPAWLVELMMAGFKIHRSARVFHEDNYVDLEAYGLKFAREHQRAAFAGKGAE